MSGNGTRQRRTERQRVTALPLPPDAPNVTPCGWQGWHLQCQASRIGITDVLAAKVSLINGHRLANNHTRQVGKIMWRVKERLVKQSVSLIMAGYFKALMKLINSHACQSSGSFFMVMKAECLVNGDQVVNNLRVGKSFFSR